MPGQDLSYLHFLLTSHPRLFKKVLLESCPDEMDTVLDSHIRDQYEKILNHPNMTTDLNRIFNRYILARCLLSSHLDPEDYFGGLPENFLPETVRQTRWVAVPVVLTGGNDGFIRWFVLGVSDFSCSLGLDDSEKIAASVFKYVNRFIHNVKESGFLCVPVMVRDELHLISGESLTLPLALGFRSLIENKPICPNIVSTGTIDRKGRIGPVGHLDVKAERVLKDFDGLLYPDSNHLPFETDNTAMIPVSHFNQAWMFARLYSKEYAGILPVLSGVSRDPLFFSLNVSYLPAVWINWLKDEGRIDHILDRTADEPALLKNLLNGLKTLVKNFDLERARAISRLISPSKFADISGRMPLLAMKWCTARLSFANHQGEITEASKWKNRGSMLVPDVMISDVNAAAEFYNHALVADHNRFCFRQNLPDSLSNILSFLEKRYEVNKRFGCMIDPVLGRLYGTLMQNSAFCGPGFIRQTCRYSEKARKRLGENVVLEFKPEWLRQHNYLSYSYLEAGDVKKAEAALTRYLQVTRCCDLKNRKNVPSSFEQALLARFFAQTPGHPETLVLYRLMLQWFGDCCRSRHPWQLVSYNLALIALHFNETDMAIRLLTKSLELCMEKKSGATVVMMALLPLSCLYSLESIPGRAGEFRTRIISALKFVDQNHFHILTRQEFKSALVGIFKDPKKFFPFTFR